MIRPLQYERLEKEGLLPVFEEIELPLISVLAHMEAQGFAVDREELLNAGERLREQISAVTSRIYSLAGQEFNINSPNSSEKSSLINCAFPQEED